MINDFTVHRQLVACGWKTSALQPLCGLATTPHLRKQENYDNRIQRTWWQLQEKSTGRAFLPSLKLTFSLPLPILSFRTLGQAISTVQWIPSRSFDSWKEGEATRQRRKSEKAIGTGQRPHPAPAADRRWSSNLGDWWWIEDLSPGVNICSYLFVRWSLDGKHHWENCHYLNSS